MYKLWRRQMAKPTTSDQMSRKKQTQFQQYLTQIIKLIRKKQQFYTKVLFYQFNPFVSTHSGMIPISSNSLYNRQSFSINKTIQYPGVRQHTSYSVFDRNNSGNGEKNLISNQHLSTNSNQPPSDFKTSLGVHDLQNQAESFVTQEDQLITILKSYQEENFYLSKTFLYTAFVRLLQIFDFSRQKVASKVRSGQTIFNKNWEKIYEDNKTILSQCYQNFVYSVNYNVVQLMCLAIKKQNHRIWMIVPARIKKNQISLKPLVRVNSSQLRKVSSIQKKPKKDEMTEILSKKLIIKQKKQMMTEKRIQQRKKAKQKPLSFKQIYGILGVKVPKIQEGNAFRRQLEIDALQRNQLIQQQRKKWQKKCQQRTHSLRNLNQIE